MVPQRETATVSKHMMGWLHVLDLRYVRWWGYRILVWGSEMSRARATGPIRHTSLEITRWWPDGAVR